MSWTNENTYYSSGVNTHGGGCEAFALVCSDAAFGNLSLAEQHSDFDRMRGGDLLRTDSDTHTVIALEKKAGSVVVAEGNYIDLSKRNTCSIHWGREIPRQELEGDTKFDVRTRYPQ